MDQNKKGSNADLGSILKTIEDNLDLYLGKKAPQLPESGKEILVKIAPYLALIGVIIGIPAVLAILGMGAFLAPIGIVGGIASGQPLWGFSFILNIIFLIVNLVLEALAIPGLFKRAKSGWQYLYYAALIGAVYNLITFNIGGLIIGGLLSMYLLFQVRSFYK